MRLTCPNCGAQYEVPDEVIPTDGRDVQCSNCGDTWFQDHPGNSQAQAPADMDVAAPARDEDLTADDADPETPSAPEPVAAPEDTGARMQQQELDPAVSEILREEAEHEARLRASEAGLESQPGLGLDDLPDDEAARRSRESRDRMARMRGEDPEEIDHVADAGSRRGLLPDIEEINSTLRASGDGAPAQPTTGAPSAPQAAGRGGFTRGFGLIMLIVVVLVLVYINAQKIAAGIPQTEPALNAYVALVDQGRVWLDSKVSGFMPK